jgi:hypothetical protein
MTKTHQLGAALLVLIALAGCDDSGTTASTGGTGAGQTAGGAAVATVKPSPARDAAVAWARAIAAGDVEAARAASTGSAADVEAAEAYFAVGASEAKLNAALNEKFGGEQTGGMITALANRLAQADVTGDDGDTATLTHDDLNTPVVVRKQPDGTWKVDVSELSAGAPIFKHMSAGTDDIEAEVRAGKHDSAEAAWAAAAAKIATRSGAPGGGPGAGRPGGKGPGGGPGGKSPAGAGEPASGAGGNAADSAPK